MSSLPGPPYLPQAALLGGVPSHLPDIPISAVLLPFFITSAILNMTILQLNLHRRPIHKFFLSGALFGFSFARSGALTMRIVWSTRPSNARIALASIVLTNAGVIVLFVVNLILAQRVFRAHHPRLGWGRPATWVFRLLYASVGACFAMVVVTVIYGFFTLDASILGRIHDVQLFAITWLAGLAFVPLPVLLLCLVLPRRGPIDDFGTGRMRTKILLLVFTSALLALGAGFRAGVSYIRRPVDDPAWFQSKACFYCFNFVIEITVIFTYALSRFDHRFYIPDGSSDRKCYSHRAGAEKSAPVSTDAVNDEERRWGLGVAATRSSESPTCLKGWE